MICIDHKSSFAEHDSYRSGDLYVNCMNPRHWGKIIIYNYIYIYIYPDTPWLHGTAIYAVPLTPLAPAQLIGKYASPMECLGVYIYIP